MEYKCNCTEEFRQWSLFTSCKCHLCLEMVSNPPPPTLLCQHINEWLSQNGGKCCCTLHVNCDWKYKKCPCPKCCSCQKYSDDIDVCETCMKRTYIYIPCQHQELGLVHCATYIKNRKRKANSFQTHTKSKRNKN